MICSLPTKLKQISLRGGGTDFSLGRQVSKAMSWRDGPKLGGSGGMSPHEIL